MRWAFLLLLAIPGFILGADTEPRSTAKPPEAQFSMRDGWLEVRVTHEGRPLEDVDIRCFVNNIVWASGETDAEGRGSFPRPKENWCQVVFNLGAGPSAPVPLTFLADGEVVPRSFPILDGTADCCKIPSVRRQRPEEPTSLLSLFLLGLVLTLLASGVLYGAVRLNRLPSSNGTKQSTLQNSKRKSS